MRRVKSLPAVSIVRYLILMWVLPHMFQAAYAQAAHTADTTDLAVDIHILAVAVNTYGEGVYDLAFAAADAEALTSRIASLAEGGGEGARVHLLTEEQATAKRVQQALSRIADEAQPDDLFIFFFAGMSSSNRRNPRLGLYAASQSALEDTSEADSSMTSALSLRQVRIWSNRIRAQRQLFLLDTCSSREAFDTLASVLTSDPLTEALSGRQIVVLGPADIATESTELESGVFTFALLQGLDGYADLDANGSLTVRELVSFMHNSVRICQSVSDDPETCSVAERPGWIDRLNITARMNGGDFLLARIAPQRKIVSPQRLQVESPSSYVDTDTLSITLKVDGAFVDSMLTNRPPHEDSSDRGPNMVLSLPTGERSGLRSIPALPPPRVIINGVNSSQLKWIPNPGTTAQREALRNSSSLPTSIDSLRYLGGEALVHIPLLPGDNQVETEIINDQEGTSVVYRYRLVQGATKRGLVQATPNLDEVRKGRDFALLFATDAYEEWSDLANPVLDARAISRELQTRYNFEVEVVENATRTEIQRKLYAYLKNPPFGEEDQLLLFFAGHGLFDEVLDTGYLVPHDARSNDPLRDSYLDYPTMLKMADRMPAKHILLVLDACHSGTADPAVRSAADGDDSDLAVSEFVARQQHYRTRRYITSARNEVVSDGLPGQHSPFARGFLHALREGAVRDGMLTLTELIGYVEPVEPGPLWGAFGQDEPGSTFLFLRP